MQEYFFSNLAQIGLILNDNPADEVAKRIIEDIGQKESLFPFAENTLKVNPMNMIKLNVDCFNSLKRFQQIYQ